MAGRGLGRPRRLDDLEGDSGVFLDGGDAEQDAHRLSDASLTPYHLSFVVLGGLPA